MPRQDEARQATPTEQLAARQTEVLGDDVLDELGLQLKCVSQCP
jgi:hypothetical protein